MILNIWKGKYGKKDQPKNNIQKEFRYDHMVGFLIQFIGKDAHHKKKHFCREEPVTPGVICISVIEQKKFYRNTH